jgi:ribosome modulation factor
MCECRAGGDGHRARLRKDRKIYREMHIISLSLGDQMRKGLTKKGKPSLTRSQLAHRESWGNGWEEAFNEAADMLSDTKVMSMRPLVRLFRLRARVRGYVPGWDRGEVR